MPENQGEPTPGRSRRPTARLLRAGLPALADFAHGAGLLRKDVGLLTDLLGAQASAGRALEGAARPFIDKVRAAASLRDPP